MPSYCESSSCSAYRISPLFDILKCLSQGLFLPLFLQHLRLHELPRPLLRPKENPAALVALPPASRPPAPPDPEVLRALHDIRTTPFRSSFLSRLNGYVDRRSTVVTTDWEARAPWMDLMEDVRAHYALKL